MSFPDILAVIHPELYDSGRETLKNLKEKVPEPPPSLQCVQPMDICIQWHCYNNSQEDSTTPGWKFNAPLLQFTNYSRTVPKMQFELARPQNITGVQPQHNSRAVRDGTEAQSNFEQLCYAYFMRDSVHKWAKV